MDKKLLSFITALGVISSAIPSLGVSADSSEAVNRSVAETQTVVTAEATAPPAPIAEVQGVSAPIVGAEDTLYKYANDEIYTHTLTVLSEMVEDSSVKGGKRDILKWEDDKGYRYGLAELTVTHKSGDDTVEDYRLCYVAVVGYSGTDLDISGCNAVSIPAEAMKWIMNPENEKELDNSSQSCVIAVGAFSGKKIKKVDLSGVEFIADSAFADCPYITEVSIPKSVRHVGKEVFSGSGLKTLKMQQLITHIPDNFCANTPLSLLEVEYPEYVVSVGKGAFSKTVLTELPFDNNSGVIEIHDSAFEGCTQITSIELPDSLLRVDPRAFSGCTGLKSLKLGKHTLVLDKSCFSNCTALKDVEFNKVLASLGGGVFQGCTALTVISKIPNTVIDWHNSPEDDDVGIGFGDAVFSGCTSLLSVELPDSLTKIPESVFYGCTSLTKVISGSNISSIMEKAFSNCKNLQEVVFNSGVVSEIQEDAFKGCSSLRNIVSEECDVIGNNAYANCSSLKSVKLSSKSFGDGVFEGCTALTSVDINFNGAAVSPERMFSGCTSLKTVSDKTVKDFSILSSGFFKGCSSLTKLNCSSARILEDDVFRDCTELKRISTGDIIAQDFGNSCFSGCSSLEQGIAGSVSTIGSSAFAGTGLRSIKITSTEGNTLVCKSNAFKGCNLLESVVIDLPIGIKYSLSSGMFEGCISLKDCTYSGTDIQKGMFSGCTNLEKLVLTNTVTDVADNAFTNCASLKSIEGVKVFKSIGSSAFSGCTNLTKTYADENTTFAGSKNYSGCDALTTASVGYLTNSMFSGCGHLAKVTLGSAIKEIPVDAFSNCQALKSINLDNIVSVGGSAFAKSGIESLKITSGNSIGKSAFAGCASLKDIDIESSTVEGYAFQACSSLSKATIVADSISSGAFRDCIALTDVEFPKMAGYELKTIYSEAFRNCPLLKEVVIPETVITLGNKSVGFIDSKTITENFLLVGTTGSAAETYAKDNKLEFMDVSKYDKEARVKERYKTGDLDLNGILSVSDVIMLKKHLLGQASGAFLQNADVTGDGKVNVFDMIALKRQVLNS